MSNFELNQKSKLFSSENDYNFEIVLKRCTASAHDLRSIKSCIKLMLPLRLEFSWDGLHHNNSKQKHSTSTFYFRMHAYLHAKHVTRAINSTLKSPDSAKAFWIKSIWDFPGLHIVAMYIRGAIVLSRHFWVSWCPGHISPFQLLLRCCTTGLQRHSAKEKIYLSF